MKFICIERQIPAQEVVQMIRNVRLTNHPDIQPYKNADINIVSAALFEPSAFYVLKSRLAFARDVRDKLIVSTGIDIFKMQGGAEISIDGGPVYQLVPPIVEATPEGDKILLDGIHRAAVARELRIPLTVIEISNVDPEWPAYSKANPNGWSDLHECDTVPAVKKIYRDIPERQLNYRDLYRDLPGTTGIREVGAKE